MRPGGRFSSSQVYICIQDQKKLYSSTQPSDAVKTIIPNFSRTVLKVPRSTSAFVSNRIKLSLSPVYMSRPIEIGDS